MFCEMHLEYFISVSGYCLPSASPSLFDPYGYVTATKSFLYCEFGSPHIPIFVPDESWPLEQHYLLR